jgi:hypothetical protein
MVDVARQYKIFARGGVSVMVALKLVGQSRLGRLLAH